MGEAESGRISEPDPGKIDGSTAKISRKGDEDARHITVRPVVDKDDHRIALAEYRIADYQDTELATALHVVSDVAARQHARCHHAESNSASAAASSPVRDACHAAAASMLRRLR